MDQDNPQDIVKSELTPSLDRDVEVRPSVVIRDMDAARAWLIDRIVERALEIMDSEHEQADRKE